MTGTRQKGVALVLVLWMSVLLAVVIGSFAIAARTETLQARQLFDGLKAEYAAQAGLHRAVYELRRPNMEDRWFTDGRAYEIQYDQAEVEIRITDESGKIDINVADEELLGRLFDSIDVSEDARDLLVDAILDWRDPDDLIRINGAEDDDYRSAGYPYGAKDAPFDTIGEVQQVMGMDYELYLAIEPAITVHSGRPVPEPAFAPVEVLRTLEGMDEASALDFVAQREQNTELGVPLPVLPDGTTPLARGGGYTFTVVSTATMPSGVTNAIEVTVRMGGVPGGQPFRILRWN
ncbi:MAG: type II secretion system protein GspK [Xanthomonadales bacterium]|nr:type II secretion system protein GspK [Xanthomonadales bacterium]